jgi:hypothetical protein
MFQGQFFMYEDDDTETIQPKIYLLDHETDQFVEQKIEIDTSSFDTLKITV